jgi:U3 small nucleolar RNA-associated protein 12
MQGILADIKAFRKFEHSKTFGVITSASSNAIWVRDDAIAGISRQTGAGRSVVGAGEEVLCWDIKKGELLGRWKDSACRAQVTVITQSKTDEDIFAVG